MRGKEIRRSNVKNCGRITPAYAGKSCNGVAYHSLNEDHPRLCGEKDVTRNQIGVDLGSPPPMRGKGLQKNTD